jgi:uncharacterized LabA/DUF88 family protein
VEIQARPNNYAFIDAQNLHRSVKEQGWTINYFRFRRYLYAKYSIRKKAFIFLGYVPEYEKMYAGFRRDGFDLIFKPTLILPTGAPKGNVDGEVILHTMIELQNFDKAVIVAGDGDYYCLVEYLVSINKLERLLIPNRNSYSHLLGKFLSQSSFISDIKSSIEMK